MPNLPAAYKWLESVDPLPRMVAEALKLFNTVEQPGPGNNPVIMQWVTELGNPGVKSVYTADSVPWCGLFMAIVAKRAAKVPPQDPLWALNWNNFGKTVGQPGLGDVITFIRPGGGHVGIYIGEDNKCYHILGGNQTDKVCFTRIDKSRMKGVRRPLYMNQPASVKPRILAADGEVSTNEN